MSSQSAAIHSRRYQLPQLHLAAACVPAGRGQAEEAGRHARLAEEAAASLDYGQERLYAAMARALACQAAGDYPGMANALGPWADDAPLDSRSRVYAVLWRPLELRGTADDALRIYARGEDTARPPSPVYAARLLLAHGRLLRRTGNRKDAVQRLSQASNLYTGLRATPFLARAEEELAECQLPRARAQRQHSVLALTSRETEVAHLVGKGLSNPEIAAELFISRKAVEYHLGNIYAKCGLQGRQQLRHFVEQWPRPAAV